MLKRPGLRLLLMFLIASLFTGLLLAGPTATLTGRVTDTTGAVIAGVKVEATNVETNVMFPGETNAEGLYNIPNLPPGTYRVIVQKFAFRTVVKPDVELHVQDVIALNFSMELGSVTQSVTVEAGAPLIQAGPQRGGTFLSREVRDLPLVGLSPISLARTLPGAIELAGSTLYAGDLYGDSVATLFSVNGQRPRANNYLLDSTENNDIQFTGVAQRFNIADAVEEVSVQTGNFGVEFGRAGGGVFNVVTKSGTNSLHGTLLWRYQSQRFNSVSNVDKVNGTPQSVFSHNVYGFTLGGPVRSDKTFFFGAFQQDTLRSTQNFSLVLPTEAAVARLRSLFPSNPQLDLYLNPLGSLRGSANPIPLQLGADPLTGVDRGVVQFASATLPLPASNAGPQWSWCGWITTVRKITGWHFAISMTPVPTRPLRSSFPASHRSSSAKPQSSLHRPLHILPDLDQRVPFLLCAARRGRTAANFSAICSAGANAAENRSSASIDSPGVRSDGTAVPPRQQPVVSGHANQAERPPHVSLRRGVPEAVGDPARHCLLSGRARLYPTHQARLLRFRQLPGRFQRILWRAKILAQLFSIPISSVRLTSSRIRGCRRPR